MEVLQALDDLTDVETGPGLAETRVVLIHQVDVIPRQDAGSFSMRLVLLVWISEMDIESVKEFPVIKTNALFCILFDILPLTIKMIFHY